MPRTELSHGTLHYHESGSGAPVVFLHGYLMGARLWDPVTRLLEGEFRCLVPELPFGAHPAPMRPDADLTAAGLGRLVADFLAAADLRDVTLVGNDSGDAHPADRRAQGQARPLPAHRVRLADPRRGAARPHRSVDRRLHGRPGRAARPA